ncbi:MAG: endo-1,4-beta-xylanase [Polyangiaceae bacterium]
MAEQKVSRASETRSSQRLWSGARWGVGALGLSLLLGSCIKRDPGAAPETAAAEAPKTESPSASAPTTAAPSQATGNYGKVAGEDVLKGEGIRAFAVMGQTQKAESSFVDVTGQPFKEALRAKVKEKSTNTWDVQLAAKTKADIQSGDVLLLTFYFRTEWVPQESGEAETEFNFELGKEPWTKSVTYSTRAASSWKQVYVPFVSKANYKAGDAQLTFRLGYPPQTVDFAGATLENFGKQLALADLPKTKNTYAGIEPDAPWRAAADARIDKLRKGDLRVVVTDAKGKPVKNASVHAKLSKHAFYFGTAAPATTLLQSGNDKFKELFVELFNMGTLENDLKWEPLAGDWGTGFTLARANQGLDWMLERGIAPRGHVLVWPGWNELPAYMAKHKNDKDKLRSEVEKHIREVVGAVKGKVVAWDVVNEPFTNHDLLDILGYEVMVDWFKIAREVDPKPKLYINDFAILSGGGGTTAHRDHYEKMIQLLVDNKAPFDGIGMQGHFGTSLTSPDDLFKLLDRYGKFKKGISVTEYDVVIDDEELAGNYTRDFYTTLFSHPAVEALIMWGFQDSMHWKGNSAMYRKDWSIKPTGQAYRDLVLGKWRTDETGQTDKKGTYKTRGFAGTYEIEVKVGDQTKTVQVTLPTSGARVDVKL